MIPALCRPGVVGDPPPASAASGRHRRAAREVYARLRARRAPAAVVVEAAELGVRLRTLIDRMQCEGHEGSSASVAIATANRMRVVAGTAG
jgi:hypothetical protein